MRSDKRKINICLLTIGQSPRDDIFPEIKPLLSSHLQIVEYGLLDKLNMPEIESLKPESGEMPLVSRLRNGRQVELNPNKIRRLWPQALKSMQTKLNIKAVGLLCTHDFGQIELSIPVIFPFNYLKFLIDHILNPNSLGVVVPLASQIKAARKKWGKHRIFVQAKSPYRQDKSWPEIAISLTQAKVEAVLLDCIGYKIKDKQTLQNLLKIPILLPRTVLAFALNQLF